MFASAGACAEENPFVHVTGGEFRSALPSKAEGTVHVRAFFLQRHPVTNAEFREFLLTHGEWRRDNVPRALAGADYLTHWQAPLEPGPSAPPSQPVTRVSWFAASEYCSAVGARLPEWYEWEFAAAASAKVPDARADPAWRQRVLDWYDRPGTETLPLVQRGEANVYGLYDMHGLVWEWVEDFNSLLPPDVDPERFCGAAAQGQRDKEDYAILMRIALLGSLRATDSERNVGFRCARDDTQAP
jgi:formylglycine-generating enzyme required for sulfatase activity